MFDIFRHPELPDDPDIMWNVKKVYGCLYSQIDAYNIEEVSQIYVIFKFHV